MKLLYTLTTYPPSTGGAQIHQHQLAQQMMTEHDVQVAVHWDNNRTDWLTGTTVRAPGEAKDYSIDGVKVHQMGFSLTERLAMAPWAAAFYPMMPTALPHIARKIEEHLIPLAKNADLIHNVRIGREGLSYASYYAAKRFNIPFVLTPVHHPRWTGWRYKMYNRLYTMADAVLTLTEAEKKIIRLLGADENKIHVIGHGPVLEKNAAPETFIKKYNIDGPMVLFLGQHYPYKGFEALLMAADMVWEKVPDTNFVFIGPQVGQSELVFRQYGDNRIKRLGKVSLQEKTDALAACSLLCVPSTQESFGGVYAEAWCFEKPVIGCDIPAVAEVITNNTDGFLVDQDPTEIAHKIIELLMNKTAAQQMGAAGKKKVNQKYTWQRIAQTVQNVYKSLL